MVASKSQRALPDSTSSLLTQHLLTTRDVEQSEKPRDFVCTTKLLTNEILRAAAIGGWGRVELIV